MGGAGRGGRGGEQGGEQVEEEDGEDAGSEPTLSSSTPIAKILCVNVAAVPELKAVQNVVTIHAQEGHSSWLTTGHTT